MTEPKLNKLGKYRWRFSATSTKQDDYKEFHIIPTITIAMNSATEGGIVGITRSCHIQWGFWQAGIIVGWTEKIIENV